MNTFSVILPTLGRPSLKDAIESVLAQTYTDWKLYIIEDGLPSDLKFLENDKRVQVYTRLGLPTGDNGTWARNFGISQSKEPWIAYIDCDDTWCPNHLEIHAEMLAQGASIAKTSGQSFKMGHKSPRHKKKVRKLGSINHDDIMTVGLSHARYLFEKTEGWTDVPNHDRVLYNKMTDAADVETMFATDSTVTFYYHI